MEILYEINSEITNKQLQIVLRIRKTIHDERNHASVLTCFKLTFILQSTLSTRPKYPTMSLLSRLLHCR